MKKNMNSIDVPHLMNFIFITKAQAPPHIWQLLVFRQSKSYLK
jgi:hypothetical protein